MQAYLTLIRTNPAYARLWLAQAVSLLGDWFNTIVLGALVARFTDGSGIAISGLLLARFLPPLLVSPFAGVLLDRLDRKRLLIISDVLRVFVVLGFLFVQSADQLWLIYALTVAQFSIAAIFEPGRSALIPSLVAPEDLVTANVLGSLTWSVMLAVGGALGGLVAGLLGTQTALLIDASTFAVSALLIVGIQPRPDAPPPAPVADASGRLSLDDLRLGWRYVRQHPEVATALLIKAGGSVGSIDALIIIYATSLFAWGEDGAGSLGVLWAAFGVGAILGPLAVARLNDGAVSTMRRLVIIGYALLTLGWLVFGGAPLLGVAAVGLLIKAMGSSIYWTYSSVILQKLTDDAYLGRIFSFDLIGFQLSTVISIIVTGAALSQLGDAQVRLVVLATAFASLIPLAGWTLLVGWLDRRAAALV